MACTRLHSSTRLPSRCSPLPRSRFLLIAWLPGGRCVEPTMPTRLQAGARCHRARQSGRAPVKRKHERRFTGLMTVPGMHEQPPRQTATITVVLLATVAWALLTSLVVPVLPLIQRDLGTDQSTAAWVVTGYLLAA